MPITDFSDVDTTPGGSSPFAPPGDFAGDEQGYATWLYERMLSDNQLHQQLAVYSKMLTTYYHGFSPQIRGPFAARLRKFCVRFDAKAKEDARKMDQALGLKTPA